MADTSHLQAILAAGHAELDAIRRGLWTRMDAEPANGDVRREAYEVGALADRVGSALIADSEWREHELMMFTVAADLDLLTRYETLAVGPSPYKGETVPPEAERRASRLRTLRELLAGYVYGTAGSQGDQDRPGPKRAG